MNPEFAKYLLMMQLTTPFIPTTSTALPLVSEDISIFGTEQLPESYVDQFLFNKVLSKFEDDKLTYKEVLGDNIDLAELFFSRTIELLCPLNPSNIIFSLTTSDSLYFRIYKGDEEITLEVFYSKYDDEDDIEAVVSVYKDDLLMKKDFGSLIDVFNNVIYQKESAYLCPTTECEYA